MEPEKKSSGALVGLIIIIIILVIGGIYIWQSRDRNGNKVMNTSGIEAEAGVITSQDSAELDTLEQDLTTTDTSTGVDVNTVQ